jgi:hypothetical protein
MKIRMLNADEPCDICGSTVQHVHPLRRGYRAIRIESHTKRGWIWLVVAGLMWFLAGGWWAVVPGAFALLNFIRGHRVIMDEIRRMQRGETIDL